MAALNERLDASERVLFRGRAHPAIWVRPGAVLGIGLFALLGAGGPAALIAIVAGGIDLCVRALQAVRTELLVTERRVLGRSGVFRNRDIEAAGADAVEVMRHGLARRLGFAFVRLTSIDGKARTVGFVAQPEALHQALARAASGASA